MNDKQQNIKQFKELQTIYDKYYKKPKNTRIYWDFKALLRAEQLIKTFEYFY